MKQFVIRKERLTAAYGDVCSWTLKCRCCGFIGLAWSMQGALDLIPVHTEASLWCQPHSKGCRCNWCIGWPDSPFPSEPIKYAQVVVTYG